MNHIVKNIIHLLREENHFFITEPLSTPCLITYKAFLLFFETALLPLFALNMALKWLLFSNEVYSTIFFQEEKLQEYRDGDISIGNFYLNISTQK